MKTHIIFTVLMLFTVFAEIFTHILIVGMNQHEIICDIVFTVQAVIQISQHKLVGIL